MKWSIESPEQMKSRKEMNEMFLKSMDKTTALLYDKPFKHYDILNRMKLLLESEKHALTPQKKQEVAQQLMDSTLFETKQIDGYLDLQEFATKIMFLLDDVELLDPQHTIAREKLWNHFTLEVQAGMAENMSLSLAARHVLLHEPSLQEEHGGPDE